MIIGINGFVGCHLAAVARHSSAQIMGVTLPFDTLRAERIRVSLNAGNIPIHETEHLTAEGLREVILKWKPDAVLHVAGYTKRDNHPSAWVHAIEGNVLLTAQVVGALLEIPQDRRPVLIMPGSQLEYGLASAPWTEDTSPLPTSPYGTSKFMTSELVQAVTRTHQLRASVIRFPLAFGPGQYPVMFVSELICKIMQGSPFPMTMGLQRRRFIYVADMARFMLHIAVKAMNGEHVPSLLNGPASHPTPLIDVANQLITLLNASFGQLQVGTLPSRLNEPRDMWPDTSRADSRYEFPITPLSDALSSTVSWYTDNKWFIDSITFATSSG